MTKPVMNTPNDTHNISPDNRMDQPRFRLQDYALILKPRVMSLVVFTAAVGLFLAPGEIPVLTSVIAILCIAVGAGASGAINMWYDQDIDHIMERTQKRPIPAGRVTPKEALTIGSILSIISVLVLYFYVNTPSAILLAITIFYYVFIYTMWLKRRTPQNIVIGGAAGAFPPMIGWMATSGDITTGPIVLFAIIFLWTPPHSWALALFRRGDYEAAGVPMMPIVAGDASTKKQMLIYTCLLIPTTLLPVFINMSGASYGITALVLGVEFFRRCFKLWQDDGIDKARPLFFFSILYLTFIFMALIIDKFLFIPVPLINIF